MDYKKIGIDIFGKVFTFLIGFLIGSRIYGKPYVWGIVIAYVIITILIRILGPKIIEMKESADRGVTARNMAVGGLNKAQDYVIDGHTMGSDIFDKIYPKVTFLNGIAMFILLVILIIFKRYEYALIVYFAMCFFIITNNIWRRIKDGGK